MNWKLLNDEKIVKSYWFGWINRINIEMGLEVLIF
jgi:hypothetical protein